MYHFTQIVDFEYAFTAIRHFTFAHKFCLNLFSNLVWIQNVFSHLCWGTRDTAMEQQLSFNLIINHSYASLSLTVCSWILWRKHSPLPAINHFLLHIYQRYDIYDGDLWNEMLKYFVLVLKRNICDYDIVARATWPLIKYHYGQWHQTHLYVLLHIWSWKPLQ